MRTKRSDLLSHLSFIVASLALALLSVPVLAQEPKPPTDEEIREAKVYEAIADMISGSEKTPKTPGVFDAL